MVATSSTVANDGTQSQYFDKKKKPCRHQCSNKRTCAHECCKVGLEATTNRGSGVVESHASFIKKRINTPMKQPPQDYQPNVDHLKRFKFDRKPHATSASSQHCNQVVPST
uniref:Uncharacterized protein n=1 Tax=Ciona savignyi TaxID=51511 RepID=H2YTA7_CIOSA